MVTISLSLSLTLFSLDMNDNRNNPTNLSIYQNTLQMACELNFHKCFFYVFIMYSITNTDFEHDFFSQKFLTKKLNRNLQQIKSIGCAPPSCAHSRSESTSNSFSNRFYLRFSTSNLEFQRLSASAIAVMDCIWRHRRKYRSLPFAMIFGKFWRYGHLATKIVIN